MTLRDRLVLFALRLGDALAAAGGWVLRAIWLWFLSLSLAGKAVVVAVGLLGLAWSLSHLGWASLADQLRDAGVLVVSVLLTWAVLRLTWTRFTQPSRQRRVF